MGSCVCIALCPSLCMLVCLSKSKAYKKMKHVTKHADLQVPDMNTYTQTYISYLCLSTYRHTHTHTSTCIMLHVYSTSCSFRLQLSHANIKCYTYANKDTSRFCIIATSRKLNAAELCFSLCKKESSRYVRGRLLQKSVMFIHFFYKGLGARSG